MISVDKQYIKIKSKANGVEKKIGLAIGLSNGFIKLDSEELDHKKVEYKHVLKNADAIIKRLEYAKKNLEEYAEYLE